MRPIARAAVVGAGTMGGGIAMTYASGGIPVLLKEVDQPALDRGLVTIRKNYESSVSVVAYYMREAYLLLEEGASVPHIDQALIDFGMPVGPFGMQDIAGINVGARIRQHLQSIGKSGAEGPQSGIPDRLYETGRYGTVRYGQKTGAGSYGYETGSRIRIPDPLIDRLAEEAVAQRGITRGPMFYAETVGLPIVLARVKEYRARFGEYWYPAPLLERLVAEGHGFYERSEPQATPT